MHYSADLNNERGVCVTWFHEHGHYIDEKCGYISHNAKFFDAIRKDFLDLTMKKSYTEIENELCDMRRHSAVSDLLHGISDEKIVGCACHKRRMDGSSYWTKDTLFEEAFAHMYECQFDTIRHWKMKKYFPTALDEFEEILRKL